MQKWIAMVAVAALGAACQTTGGEEEWATGTQPREMGRNERDIAAAMIQANTNEIDTARIALERSSDPGVREFAQTLVDEHTMLNDQTRETSNRIDLSPEAGPMAQQLRRDGEQTMARLEQAEEAVFDRLFLESQIQMHSDVLGMIERDMMPDARQPELRALLEQSMPVMQRHLEEARRLQQAREPALGVNP